MFRTVSLSIIRSFSPYTHSNCICHAGLLAACEQDQDVPSWSWWWAYVPETCRAKYTSIKLPSCIKLAFHFMSWGRCTVKPTLKNFKSEWGLEYPTCSKRTSVNWIGYILRRNCLLKQVIEGKVDGTGRRGIRRKQPVDDIKKARRYWKWNNEHSVDNSLWEWLWTCHKTPALYVLCIKKVTQ